MTTGRRRTIFVLTGLATFALGLFVAPLDNPRPRINCWGHRVRVTAQQSQWPVLLSFLDRDLSKLDRQSEARLRHAIDNVTNGLDPELSPSLTPRVFQLVSNSTGEKRLLLVEIDNLTFTVGGVSHLRLLLFDLEGRLLYAKTSNFYKEVFGKVRVRKSRDVPGDVLVTEAFNFVHRTHYFYRLVGNEITPIERKGVSR